MRINTKQNNFAKAHIDSLTLDNDNSRFIISLNLDPNLIVYKSSTSLENALKKNRKLDIFEIFLKNSDVNGQDISIQSNNLQSETFLEITSSNFEEYSTQNIINIVTTWSPINYQNLVTDFTFDDTSNENKIIYTKIGARKVIVNSGISTKAINKIISDDSNELSTLPSSKITTGKILQDFNHKFNDIHTPYFLENQPEISNSISLPIVNLTKTVDENTSNIGYYIATNQVLDLDNPDSSLSDIDIDSPLYDKRFDLKNTNIFNGAISIDNADSIINQTRNITRDTVDYTIKEDRFEENIEPFREESFYFEEESSRSVFFTESINPEDNTRYSLGEQKQIKIELDFSEDIDLHLLNTKFSFIHPDLSSDKNDFRDNENNKNKIYDTKYFNFVKSEKANAYSSHHMPTAYWNNTQKRWSYLDSSDENFLGAKIYDGGTTQIINNFIFNDDNSLNLEKINQKNLKEFKYLHYNKPILTTPGFRNDGSLLKSVSGEDKNKSFLSQITDTYGFPYKGNWQPNNDHLIDMSKYLSKDFLLEKMIIKGKYTTLVEMPTKKGNFASGYRQNDDLLPTQSVFENHTYTYKDNLSNEIISNNVTFFLLNEKNNENYFQNNIKNVSLQHYTFLNTDVFEDESFNFSFGENISTLEGSFESNNNLVELQVGAYLIENNQIYANNQYNNLTLDVSGGLNTKEFHKSRFHYLDSPNSDDTNLVSPLYHISEDSWDNIWENDLLTDDSNIIAKIKNESLNNFNINSSRDLVTYSNMMIMKKNENLELDNEVFKNIDLIVEKTSPVDSGSSNYQTIWEDSYYIDVNTPETFCVTSFCKNSNISNNYTDESSYKIKSNFQEEVVIKEEEIGEIFIKNSINSLNDNNKITLFSFTDNPVDYDKSEIVEILGFNLKSFNLNNPGKGYVLENFPKSVLRIKNNNLEDDNPSKTLPLTEIIFEYDNPITYNGVIENNPYGVYVNNFNNKSKIYLSDFIKIKNENSLYDFEDLTPQYKNVTKIYINLRFLDTWSNAGIDFNEFFNYNFIGENENVFSYSLLGYSSSKFLPIVNKSGRGWDNLTLQEQNKAISLLTYYALNSTHLLINETTNNLDGGFKNPFYPDDNDANPEFLTSYELFHKEVQDDFHIHLYEIDNEDLTSQTTAFSIYNKISYNNNNSNNSVYSNKNYDYSLRRDLVLESEKISFSLPDRDLNLADVALVVNDIPPFIVPDSYLSFTESLTISQIGNNKITQNIQLDQESYILQGKTKNSNNIDLQNSEVINKEVLSNNKISRFKSKSGKYLQSGNSFNSAIKSNYLLKPEDRLVFGVSSNCNGQVAPTVFKLHDKVEIILIGRDFVDDKLEYKNNISKSIRKVVLGDNFIEKSGTNIYQTRNSYFDNIWNRKKLNTSLEDFKNSKFTIDLNSNRNAGTYSGVVTLSEEKTYSKSKNIQKFKSENIYIKDTVKPSLGKVFNDSNCLNLKTLKTKNIKNEDVQQILISEKYSNLETPNIINEWHNDYHLEKYKSFFYDEINFTTEESTFSNIPNENNIPIEICFDMNSIKTNYSNVEYKNLSGNNFYEYYDENIVNEDEINEIKNNILNYGKSLKSFVLPSSNVFSYQNGIQIQNEKEVFTYYLGNKRYSKFLNNNININKKNNSRKVNILQQKSSIQFFDSTLNSTRNSLTEYSNEIYEIDSNNIDFNPQWHLVVELSLQQLSFLLDQTIDESNSSEFVGNDYSLFLYEDNVSASPVLKSCKIYSLETDSDDNSFFLLTIPLYFWETLEIDDNFLNDDTQKVYGRLSQKIHNFNRTDATWYSKVNSITGSEFDKIIDSTDIYKPFISPEHYSEFGEGAGNVKPVIAAINSSKEFQNNNLPYTIEELNQSNISGDSSAFLLKDKLILNIDFYISQPLFENASNQKRPVYQFADDNLDSIENNYKLNNNKNYFTHEIYYENNKDLIKNRRENKLLVSDFLENTCLNEKVYNSKIYKKRGSSFVETSYYLIYKIHKMYVNVNTDEVPQYDPVDNPINDYNIIEIIGIDNSHILFEKDRIDNNSLFLDFENTDILRVYEDKLLNNNYFSKSKENIPYFEINTASLSKGFEISNENYTLTTNGIYQILKTHIEIKNNSPNINVTEDLNNNIIESGRTGSPIYTVKSNNNSNYKYFNNQEDSIKTFLYGFSKGKYRYPVQNIDGFKYGVESPCPKTLNFKYSNKRYGHFSDKVMGSINVCSVRKDKSGKSLFTDTVFKSFVNSKFVKIESSQAVNTYNKDNHARSTYPFVENSQDQLSGYYQSNQ